MAPGGGALTGRVASRRYGGLLLAALAAGPLAAQHVAAPGATAGDTLSVVPEPGLARGDFHRKLFGEDYRDLWTTPLQLPVFDLTVEGGGLTPVEEGGGMQTASLHLEGADGRDYVFRSLGKDPTKVLPEEVRKSTLGELIRDQLAAAHPTGPLVASRLLQAAGVLHAPPRLGIMPDDPLLGRFRERYAGLVGYLEERPTAGKQRPHFADASDVEGTFEMFERLQESPEEQFDRRAFVRARLMDFLLGDWDRHADQWRWARFEDKGTGTWRPIPRDRDQAFSDYEGALLGVARRAVPKLGAFDSALVKHVPGLMYNGRVVDRRLLGSAAPELYDSVAHELQAALTDSVIEWAVSALPPEHLAKDGAHLAGTLRARRVELPEAAGRFANALGEDINLFGTDDAEFVRIERSGREVSVAFYASADSAARDVAWLRRRTTRKLTHEVRLYLLGGDDEVRVSGEALGGPSVFVVGGTGIDRVVDASSGERLELYDADSLAVEGHEHRVRHTDYDKDIPTEDNTVPPRDFGRASSITPIITYRSEFGWELGFAWSRSDFGFRAQPWLSRLSTRLSVATGSGGVRADVRYERQKRMSRSRWEVLAHVSQLTQIGYYGFGNETPPPAEDLTYNRVRNTQVLLRPSYIAAFGKHSELEFGPALHYTDTRLDEARLIGQQAPRGTPTYGQVGLRAEWNADLRHADSTGFRGWRLSAGGSWWPRIWDVTKPIGEIHAMVSTTLPAPTLPLRPALALRAGARKVWGPYPYFDAALVGGSRSVRGLREQRYAGDAGVLANAELRVRLGTVNLFLPAHIGASAFTDVGRVFLSGEDSRRWHAGFGGGLWASAFRPENVLSLTVARAEERTAVYFTAGFMF